MSPINSDSSTALSPTELRAIFGQNLRKLCQAYPSISAVCRALDTNRTQFNKYLSGDSFPRPDVLQKICTYFGAEIMATARQAGFCKMDQLWPDNETLLRPQEPFS